MKKTKIIAVAAAFAGMAISPLLSQAHPGHGETEGYTIIHYFVELPHALVTWGVILSVGALSYYLLSRRAVRKQKNSGDA